MKAVIELNNLKRIIKSTGKFISKDENRPMLQYIQLNFNKEDLTVQACGVDGYKISVESAKCIDIDESFTAYIKPYLPVGVKDEYAIVEILDGNCFIKVGYGIVGYKQPNGTYLDVQAISKSFQDGEVKYRIALNKDLLLDLIKSVQHEDKMLANNPLVLEFRESLQPVVFKTKNGFKAVLPMRDRT